MASINSPTISELEIKVKLYQGDIYKKDIVGLFISEQSKLLKDASERGYAVTHQFSMLRDADVEIGNFLKIKNKKYKILKIIKNMTHADLSLGVVDE